MDDKAKVLITTFVFGSTVSCMDDDPYGRTLVIEPLHGKWQATLYITLDDYTERNNHPVDYSFERRFDTNDEANACAIPWLNASLGRERVKETVASGCSTFNNSAWRLTIAESGNWLLQRGTRHKVWWNARRGTQQEMCACYNQIVHSWERYGP